MSERIDPKLLSRSGVLACYDMLSNQSLTDAYRQGALHEIFEHVDAQGRLLARAGNYIHKLPGEVGGDHDDEALAIIAEIKRAMA